MRATSLFFALLVALLSTLAHTSPTPAPSALGKWIDEHTLDPLIDKYVTPGLHTTLGAAVATAKPLIVAAVPPAVRETLAELLGVRAIASDLADDGAAKCGWLAPLCAAVLRPLDRIIVAVETRVHVALETAMASVEDAVVKVTAQEIKDSFGFDDSPRSAVGGTPLRVNKRGARAWYVGKVNAVMARAMDKVRPQVRGALRIAAHVAVDALPANVRHDVNAFLPDRLKLMDEATGKPIKRRRGIMDSIKAKVAEWQAKIVKAIQAKVDSVFLALENDIMARVRVAAHKGIAEALPFYDESDATFKN
ncbi:hypothetical protein BC828DRAFT_377669 [Blastocladiella britannica]|nr:hypothetical protein BC828DRAFT_377669 [Blastocladiella britannica]